MGGVSSPPPLVEEPKTNGAAVSENEEDQELFDDPKYFKGIHSLGVLFELSVLYKRSFCDQVHSILYFLVLLLLLEVIKWRHHQCIYSDREYTTSLVLK